MRIIVPDCPLECKHTSTLHWKKSPDSEGNAWDAMYELLRELSKVEISLGRENLMWYLNLMPDIKDAGKKVGYPRLFSENKGAGKRNR